MRMSLAHLTVLDASPLELLDAAKAGGFDAAGLRIIPPMPSDRIVEVIGNEPLLRSIIRRMEETGVAIWDIEAVWLTPQTEVSALLPALEVGQRLGARHLLVVGHDPVFDRMTDNFAALCERCAAFQLKVAFEMMSYVEVKTLRQAKAVFDVVKPTNASLLIDALHFFRSGATLEDLVGIDPALLEYVHLCDGVMAPPPPDELRAEGRGGRLYPGEGEFPLVDLLHALPNGIGLAVEAPNAHLADLNVFERARRCGDATRRFAANL
jgi:sugar phosphate isomerase/epimerase